ncbi:uncharacterized protein LOC108863946, partial [Galendromus occidentalis]|uniref:Uncharacterized protein LOC108863946 n=1 Tax=Galendromus occidentalis TaxID=34638 RepID=A0AAJ7L4X2_9ACAR
MAPPATRRKVQHSPTPTTRQPTATAQEETRDVNVAGASSGNAGPAPTERETSTAPPMHAIATLTENPKDSQPQANAGEETPKRLTATATVPTPVRLTPEPPKFKPGDDAARWLKSFERIATHNVWQGDFKLQSAEICMTDLALQWAETQSERLTTWATWKAAFAKRFDNGRVAQAKQQLRKLIRSEEDSLIDHLDRVEWLCRQTSPSMQDEEIIENFGNTISEEEFAFVVTGKLTKDLQGLRETLELRQNQAKTRNKSDEPKASRTPVMAA